MAFEHRKTGQTQRVKPPARHSPSLLVHTFTQAQYDDSQAHLGASWVPLNIALDLGKEGLRKIRFSMARQEQDLEGDVPHSHIHLLPFHVGPSTCKQQMNQDLDPPHYAHALAEVKLLSASDPHLAGRSADYCYDARRSCSDRQPCEEALLPAPQARSGVAQLDAAWP